MASRTTRALCLRYVAATTESFAGEQRLLAPGDFQTCRSWKMWNSFGDFAAADASSIATSELEQAHAAMKQSDRHASRWLMGSSRRFTPLTCLSPGLPGYTNALVVHRG